MLTLVGAVLAMERAYEVVREAPVREMVDLRSSLSRSRKEMSETRVEKDIVKGSSKDSNGCEYEVVGGKSGFKQGGQIHTPPEARML